MTTDEDGGGDSDGQRVPLQPGGALARDAGVGVRPSRRYPGSTRPPRAPSLSARAGRARTGACPCGELIPLTEPRDDAAPSPAQLAQRVARDPARAARGGVAAVGGGAGVGRGEDGLGRVDRRRVQRRVALADVAQRPVDGLLHEVAVVAGLAPDTARGSRRKRSSEARLVVDGERGRRGERRALDPLLVARRPFAHFVVGERRLVEEVGRQPGRRRPTSRSRRPRPPSAPR